MRSREALLQAVAVAGSQQKLADAIAAQGPRWPNGEPIKVRQGNIPKWIKRGYAPSEVCIAIEQATGISREDLRADVFTSDHLEAS